MRNLKRLASLVLAVIMVIGCLPVSVFAVYDPFVGITGGSKTGSTILVSGKTPFPVAYPDVPTGLHLSVNGLTPVQKDAANPTLMTKDSAVTLAKKLCTWSAVDTGLARDVGVWVIPGYKNPNNFITDVRKPGGEYDTSAGKAKCAVKMSVGPVWSPAGFEEFDRALRYAWNAMAVAWKAGTGMPPKPDHACYRLDTFLAQGGYTPDTAAYHLSLIFRGNDENYGLSWPSGDVGLAQAKAHIDNINNTLRRYLASGNPVDGAEQLPGVTGQEELWRMLKHSMFMALVLYANNTSVENSPTVDDVSDSWGRYMNGESFTCFALCAQLAVCSANDGHCKVNAWAIADLPLRVKSQVNRDQLLTFVEGADVTKVVWDINKKSTCGGRTHIFGNELDGKGGDWQSDAQCNHVTLGTVFKSVDPAFIRQLAGRYEGESADAWAAKYVPCSGVSWYGNVDIVPLAKAPSLAVDSTTQNYAYYSMGGTYVKPKSVVAENGTYTDTVTFGFKVYPTAEYTPLHGTIYNVSELPTSSKSIKEAIADAYVGFNQFGDSAFKAHEAECWAQVGGKKASVTPTFQVWVYGFGMVDIEVTPEQAETVVYDTNGYHGDGNIPSATLSHNTPGGYVPNSNPYEKIVREAPRVLALDPSMAQAALSKQTFKGQDGKIHTLAELFTVRQYKGSGVILETQNIQLLYDAFVWEDGTQLDAVDIQIEREIVGTLDVEKKETRTYWSIVDGGWKIMNWAPTVSHVVTKKNAEGDVEWIAHFNSQGTPSEAEISFLNIPKFDWGACTTTEPEHPTYYSTYQQPYNEFKQGDIYQEKFNSMTGTPTFTETQRNELVDSGYYNKDGHYYQYYAAGGSEFVIEFDGKYIESDTATRTYTAEFSPVPCEKNGGACHEEPTDDGSIHVVDVDHCPCAEHDCSDTFTWTQGVKGFSYVRIDNLRVWKLSEARLDGTYALLDQNYVQATVQSQAPAISYNIADRSGQSNTSANGRLVYTWETAQKDTVSIPGYSKESSDSHSSHRSINQAVLDGDTAGIVCGATCVSDYIILHTSNGDQAILYYEYKSKNEAAINTGGCNAEDIEFDPVPYDVIWKTNSRGSAEACALPEDGVTYGGYNGKYNNMSGKYKSFGWPANMSDWSSTIVYKTPVIYSGNQAFRGSVSKIFRLQAKNLVIPDNKLNQQYDFGESYVFYEEIEDYTRPGTHWGQLYASSAQPKFGGKRGFVLTKVPYANTGEYTEKCNSVVVFNPVSNEDSFVVSLPEWRDQRMTPAQPTDPPVEACPGDQSCEFMELECKDTSGHLHTEECFSVSTYPVHTGNNVHEHVDTPYTDEYGAYHAACPYRMEYNHNWRAGWCTSCLAYTSNTPGGDCDDGYRCTICGAYYDYGDPQPNVPCSGGGGGSYGCTCACCGNPACPRYCSNHRYACDSNCPIANPRHPIKVYLCNNQPMNKHKCVQPGEYDCGFAPNAHAHNSSCPTTTVNNDTGARCEDCGGCVPCHVCGGSIPGHGGTRTEYVCSNQPYNTHNHDGNCKKATMGCYTAHTSSFNCNNPHHTWNSNWKVFTTGLPHESGRTCTGRSCTDNSRIQIPYNRWADVSTLRNSAVVEHLNGSAHLSSATNGTCTWCNKSYARVLFTQATEGDRSLSGAEIERECGHYKVGDLTCWKPCGSTAKHSKWVQSVDVGGTTLKRGDFINLDYGFTIYYPNTGDFFGNGISATNYVTGYPGYGYTDDMDITEWVSKKWVVFPFDVVHKGVSYLAGERIYLRVPDVFFDFYCPLENSEINQASVYFGMVAINDPSKELVENQKDTNFPYNRYDNTHQHDAGHTDYIDVVGRIGALTMNDVGDFRYSNFFKKVTTGWLVPNVLRRVDTSKQHALLVDQVDIRGLSLGDTYIRHYPDGPLSEDSETPEGAVRTNTYGTWDYGSYRDKPKDTRFPLVPQLLSKEAGFTQPGSNQSAVATQPMRIGYQAYMDFTTLGNYYGQGVVSEGGGTYYCNVLPHYYRMNIQTGDLEPVDVYLNRDGTYVLINDADKTLELKADQPVDECVSLNWTEEAPRRNYFTREDEQTKFVESNYSVGRPKGSSWLYGTYDCFNLLGRNRTSIGTDRTYGVNTNPNSERANFPDSRYWLQGARWHFNLGVPSSSVFVLSNREVNEDTIKECMYPEDANQFVIVVALEIYAYGDVWNLAYDGHNINANGLQVTPNSPVVYPHPVYPKQPDGSDPPPSYLDPGSPMEMPVVTVISLNHSSKEDINQAGTH